KHDSPPDAKGLAKGVAAQDVFDRDQIVGPGRDDDGGQFKILRNETVAEVGDVVGTDVELHAADPSGIGPPYVGCLVHVFAHAALGDKSQARIKVGAHLPVGDIEGERLVGIIDIGAEHGA